jgi:hypothetical protein
VAFCVSVAAPGPSRSAATSHEYCVWNERFEPIVSATGPLGVVTIAVLLSTCVRGLPVFASESAVFAPTAVIERPVMFSP